MKKTSQPTKQQRIDELIQKAFQCGFDFDPEEYTLRCVDDVGLVFAGDVIQSYVNDGEGTSGAIINVAIKDIYQLGEL